MMRCELSRAVKRKMARARTPRLGGIESHCSRFDALEGKGRLTREGEIADHVAAMLSLPA